MIKGIGIDTVYIPRIQALLDKGETSFFQHTFTAEENRLAPDTGRKAEYYAARFAAKEAVFKALAPLTAARHFDLRTVESLHHEDGSPYIHITAAMEQLLQEAQAEKILLSITTEQDYATAFVLIQ